MEPPLFSDNIHPEDWDTVEVQDQHVQENWVQPLPEFNIDWRAYFDEPLPTTGTQWETPLYNEDESQTMGLFDIATRIRRRERRRELSVGVSTETPGHKPVFRPLRPWVADPLANENHQDYESQHVHGSGPSSLGLLNAIAMLPGTAPPAVSPRAFGVMIGTIYSSTNTDAYTFRCHDIRCYNQTFSRWHDFIRHYNGAHAINPMAYWCGVEGCPRSKAVGGRPFPRKDKLDDHVKSIHGLSS